MCTLSFLPLGASFALAMNRDEKKSRAIAEGPRRRIAGRNLALHPAEPGGGTWIGINHKGVAAALLNWHQMPERQGPSISRGIVVPHVLKESRLAPLGSSLERLTLDEINPFRLIAISWAETAIEEWRWDGSRLTCRPKPWRRQHWFSSGVEEVRAAHHREKAAAKAARATATGTLSWLRRLHRSHGEAPGAFSICMHREDAETVSYAEILAGRTHAEMRYARGALCKEKPGAPVNLAFTNALPQPAFA